MTPRTLSQWLTHLETAHSNGLIDMGLERAAQVRHAIQLNPACPVITVGGTNGKGSTCAFLTHIYAAAGYRVGTLTSPHLLRFNERIAINGSPVADETITAAFERIEAARGSVSLTYFEFNTLAAIDIFQRAGADIMILEVGLGGRLDAVNIFDADCAVLTNVGLDHQQFLGDTIEQVGYEKAGIFRTGKPAVCGQNPPPESVTRYARNIGANLMLPQQDFSYRREPECWHFVSGSLNLPDLPLPALAGAHQTDNAACALAAVAALTLPVSRAAIEQGLQQAENIGRFQIIRRRPTVIWDVGHNPHAAHALKRSLNSQPPAGTRTAVFSMLSDKDIDSVLEILCDSFDQWYTAPLHLPRGMSAEQLNACFARHAIGNVHSFANVQTAYRAALSQAQENDRITVFGSFHTVAEAATA